jgi:hypothetical protein
LFEDKRPKEEEKNLGKFQVFKQFQLEHSVFIASLQHFQSGIYFTLIHEHDVSKKADRGIILQDRDTIFLLLIGTSVELSHGHNFCHRGTQFDEHRDTICTIMIL